MSTDTYVSICDALDSDLQRLMSTYVMLYNHIYKYGALHVSSFLYNRVLVLPQSLHAVVKAAIEVAGCCGGCQIGCRLPRRLPHRLQAAIKVACCYKVYNRGCYKGFHIGCSLLQRLHAAVKAEIEVVGYCEGCHKAAEKVAGCCEGCKRAYWLLQRLPHRLQVVVKAATKVAGCCKGCHNGNLTEMWEAIMEVMAEIIAEVMLYSLLDRESNECVNRGYALSTETYVNICDAP
ncbi:hypothetical protein Tco_0691805 [Tanacetum coccineum]